MTTNYFTDWRGVPEKLWRWPNFSPEEIACRGDGKIQINEAALDKLQALRDQFEVPLIVHSAYRSPEYNRRVGGAKHSMHLQGAAFDISMANHDPESFEAAARAVGFTGFGFHPRQNFMHVDIGRARQWGDPFPPRASRFANEPPRLRENLTESRTMKGGGAAGVATIGAAGVEVAQQAVADTQSAIQPLIPYLDTLRWLFIAAALIGVGVTIYARWDDWRKAKR
jgi:zinc D-Ala-D-Ala carboxypeptidase